MGNLAKELRIVAKAYHDSKLDEAIRYYRSSNILDIILLVLREVASEGGFNEEIYLRHPRYTEHKDAIEKYRDIFINLISSDLRKLGFNTTICFTTPARQTRYIIVNWRLPRRWWHALFGG